MIVCNRISNMTEGVTTRQHMVLNDDGQVLGHLGDAGVAKKAELELHEKMETMVAEKDTPYATAFRSVMGAPKNKALVQVYVGLTADRYAMERAQPDADMTALDVGVEVDRRVKTYMREHPETTYQDATDFVLSVDPVLKSTYAKTNY